MRKLSWIIAGILCTAPVFVHAAELGDAKIASHLTERLDVKIPITGLNGVSLDQVKVRLAPEKYYQQAGLSLDGLAGNITFQITSEGKRNYVIVRSKRAISNPILSLLIQINAGDGSQVKEFDFLLDPPVHAERRAMAASQNSFTGNVAEPAKTSRPVQSTSSWTPVANVPDVKMGGTYNVKRGDTLYDIAKTAVADKLVPVRPMMQAIINANPNAFIDGNGNLMKAGSKLKVPERAAVATVAPATAATEKAAGVQAPEAASTEAKPKLQLLAVEPDKEKATAATPEAAAPAAGTVTGGEMTGVLPAIDTPATPNADAMQQNNEAIASIDAKSEVMSKQISMLNDQLKQVQGLVSERNQNIEQLQQKIKESNEQTQLLKKQLEAQNNNFWLQWAPYLMGGVGLLIIILLLVAISRGRKREPVESTIYSTTGAGALATQPKVEMEPRVVAEVAPKAPTVPSASVVADSKSVIDEARLLISYNLHTQAHDLVEDAIAQQPNELSLYQELARMYSEANNTAELEKVLTRIDEKFGPEHRPNNEELAIYSPAPTMLEMESAEASTEVFAPDQSDALDAIPDSAFSFDADLDLPSKESADTSLDFDEPNQDSPQVVAERDLETLSLEGAEEPAPKPEDIDLELGDNTPEVPETVEEALPDLEPEDETSVQDDTRLGLAEAFLGVGDQESYKMIAEEIESEGNPALIAALKKIEQKFS